MSLPSPPPRTGGVIWPNISLLPGLGWAGLGWPGLCCYAALILLTPGEGRRRRGGQMFSWCGTVVVLRAQDHNYRLGTTGWPHYSDCDCDWHNHFKSEIRVFWKCFFRPIVWNRLFTKLILSWILKQVNCFTSLIYLISSHTCHKNI